MSDTAVTDFLAQFSASKTSLTDWPVWMRESARVATASFPKPHHIDVKPVQGQEHTTKLPIS
jgi:hypothetical protein